MSFIYLCQSLLRAWCGFSSRAPSVAFPRRFDFSEIFDSVPSRFPNSIFHGELFFPPPLPGSLLSLFHLLPPSPDVQSASLSCLSSRFQCFLSPFLLRPFFLTVTSFSHVTARFSFSRASRHSIFSNVRGPFLVPPSPAAKYHVSGTL